MGASLTPLVLPVRVEIPCDIFELLFLYQHFRGKRAYYLYTHTNTYQMQGAMSLFILRIFFSIPEKLTLLSGSVLICTNLFILACSEAQIILFLFGKVLIPKCVEL